MARLEQLCGGPRLYIKRDDCTGLATGGNKTRKLEFAIGEALAHEADTVITVGGLQSNHARQTAAAAAQADLACELVLTRNVPIDDPTYRANGNVLLDRLLGAQIHVHSADEDRAALASALAAQLESAGRRPYVIPVGASYPIGSLGYANAALELVHQANALGLSLDYLVTATSSGGTMAGLAAGFDALSYPITLIGVDVDSNPDMKEAIVLPLVEQTKKLIGQPGKLSVVRLEVVLDQAGPGYGIPTAEMQEALRLVARNEGIVLDPVYSGKGMAGLIGLVRAGRFEKNSNVVFLHTGGSSALFAYQRVLQDDTETPDWC
jgi:L-cysteate sulfo-lyase